MKSFSATFVLFVLVFQSLVAQQNTTGQESNSIESQITEIIEKSSSYQFYKVIPKVKLQQLKANIMDTLAYQQKIINQKKEIIALNKAQINQLNSQISSLEVDLSQISQEKESMSILGMLISKTTYSLIMWGLVFVLVAFLALYISKFSRSNVVTRKSVKELKELQEEYENHRKTALEREQKVRRQLQDEINKNRGI